MASILRRLRPYLIPKNSKRENSVRFILAFYSRALHHLRKYEYWQRRNQTSKSFPTNHKNLHFFTYQPNRLSTQMMEAFSASTAQWILIASSSLQLAPSALAEIEQAIAAYPQADLIYTDGDRLTRHGKRANPWFKPAFGIDSLRAQNYVAPFFAVRKSLGDSIGWFDPAAGSAWAEDLLWRAVEHARQVVHIPKVLYHQTGDRPVSFQDERRVLQAHLERAGWSVQVESGPAPHIFRLRYSLREKPLISIIIPNHDLPGELLRCVDSILEKTAYPNFEILILENNSKGAGIFQLYEDLQARDSRVRVLEYHHSSFNYAEINNFGARQARGDILLFLNNDTEVITPDWLERMLEYAQRSDVGAVGAKLYYPQNLIQHVGVILGIFGTAGHQFANFPRAYPGYYHSVQLVQNFSAVTAACLMMRRQVFDEVGGFDTAYRLAYNDIDLCMKIREQGYLITWTPYAELYHHESLSRGYDSNAVMLERLNQERQTFIERWRPLLQQGDPYYNPNLALDRGYYSLRFPPGSQEPRAMPGLLRQTPPEEP